MGWYHLGVLKALQDQQLLPNIFSGSSAGAIIVGKLATLTDEEFTEQLLHPKAWMHEFIVVKDGTKSRRLQRFLSKGVILDMEILQQRVRETIGDYTFREAFDRTGRSVSITVSPKQAHEAPLVLNHVLHPDVLIWSAAAASCGIPGVFEAPQLYIKATDGSVEPYHIDGLTWMDGSIVMDLPRDALAELYNVNNVIASQVNPAINWFVSQPVPRHPATGLSGRLFQACSTLLQFLKNESAHQAQVLLRALRAVAPSRVLGQVTRLGLMSLGQRWHGDVTIQPPFKPVDYLDLLGNPQMSALEQKRQDGQRFAWAQTSRMLLMCEIEIAIRNCLEDLKMQTAATVDPITIPARL